MKNISAMINLVLVFLICSISTTYSSTSDDQTQVMNCTRSDLEALIDLKNGFNDPENRLSSWRGSRCCRWRGISCGNRGGAVTVIDLHNPYPVNSVFSSNFGFWNLSGEIRPSVLKLKSLKHLDLSFNTFGDIPIPGFLGSLRNLQYLNLSNSGFSGKIPQNLGNLSSLQFLDVSCDFFGLTVDDLQWVAGLHSLKHLEMNNVDLSLATKNWVKALNHLPNLTELHLSNCLLSSFPSSLSFINFTSLAVVDLSLNSFNSKFPDWFANLTSLIDLNMMSSDLFGRIPLGLRELPNLKHLNLASNDNLSADCHELFGEGWRKIEVISLGSSKLHGKLPSYIGNMMFLTYFDLMSCNIEGGIPGSIGKLCNLVHFDVSDNNLTGNLPESLEGTGNCIHKRPFPNLMNLVLSNNKLVGELPKWLGQLRQLERLELSYNLLEGPIPYSLGTLQNLTSLGLGGNRLNGTLPESFGQLSEVEVFDVSSNRLTGSVTEKHFSKMKKVKILLLASNSLVLKVSSGWIPPFQVRNIDMGSCQLGPGFPEWVRHQKEIMYLNFPNTSISGTIPSWFWDISSNLSLLNVSMNRLEGHLPSPLAIAPYADVDLSSNLFEGTIPVPVSPIELLDLSDNRFSGSIPQNLSALMPELIFLALSGNKLTGKIPESVGDMALLQVIDFSGNSLTGRIPSNIANCLLLKALDLGNNTLTGEIPDSFGKLTQLQPLHLSNNNLSGEIPASFQNLSSLETLDLGNNKLSGEIPRWFGDIFPNLRILSLRNNSFSGGFLFRLSNLTSLQVLDLADNELTAKIPASLGDLKAIAEDRKINQYLLYGNYRGRYYEESLVVNLKDNLEKYTKTLSLVTSIDLSGNHFYGDFPEEITNLAGLVILNLSRNNISGDIPMNISRLKQLGSLDLSGNKLSGTIPSTMSQLSSLGFLDLSDNDLTGKIPDNGQMATFAASAYAGNPGLCGEPLVAKCQTPDQGKGNSGNEEDEFYKWLSLSVGLGFAVGLLVPFLILASKRSWGGAYFSLVEKIAYGLSGFINGSAHHKNTPSRGMNRTSQ